MASCPRWHSQQVAVLLQHSRSPPHSGAPFGHPQSLPLIWLSLAAPGPLVNAEGSLSLVPSLASPPHGHREPLSHSSDTPGGFRDQHPSLPIPSAFLFLPQSQPSGCSTGLRIRQNPKVGIQALPFTSYVATGQSLILPKPQFLNQKTGIKTPYSQAVGSIVKSLACVRETGQPGDHPCPYLRILPPSLA